MASVTFDSGAYVHMADDLFDFVFFERREPSTTRAPEGSVYITAAGTRRWTSSPGVSETFHVSTRTRDADVYEWLNTRDGELILYRDKRSRLEYGIITSVSVNDLNSSVFEISIDIHPVDHTLQPVEGGG